MVGSPALDTAAVTGATIFRVTEKSSCAAGTPGAVPGTAALCAGPALLVEPGVESGVGEPKALAGIETPTVSSTMNDMAAALIACRPAER